MNQKQYLDALKKALKGIDKNSRDIILLEIKGIISEFKPQESIAERLGTPDELAEKYLEDETVQPSVGKKVTSLGKKIFLGIGVGITLLVIGILLFAWYFSQDSFNYADTTAKELDKNSANWKSVDWNAAINIEVDQGRAIIYWHDQASIRWNCGEEQEVNPQPNKVLKIRHDQCLLFLPTQALEIKATQADIVLVQPQAAISITLNQTKLRIAENGTKYKFDINGTRSGIGNFVSHDDAQTTITIKSEESQIEAYDF